MKNSVYKKQRSIRKNKRQTKRRKKYQRGGADPVWVGLEVAIANSLEGHKHTDEPIRGVIGPRDGNRSPCVINAESGKLTYTLQNNTSGAFTFDPKTRIEYTMIHTGDQRKMRIRFNARCTHNGILREYDSLADFTLDQPHVAREIIRKMRGEREPESIQIGDRLVYKNFDNAGVLCYRNCIYSMLLNNEVIQAQIRAIPEDGIFSPQQRNFIRCLQMIVNPETATTHPNANSTSPETFGSQILQINTALFELSYSDQSVQGSNEILDNNPANENMGSMSQCDADEFLKYFIEALENIGIKPFESVRLEFAKMEGLPVYWDKRAGAGEENRESGQLKILDDRIIERMRYVSVKGSATIRIKLADKSEHDFPGTHFKHDTQSAKIYRRGVVYAVSGGESDNLNPSELYKEDPSNTNTLNVATYMEGDTRYLVPVIPETATPEERISANTRLKNAEYFPQSAYLVKSRYLKDRRGNIRYEGGGPIEDPEVKEGYVINPQAVLVPDAVHNYSEPNLLANLRMRSEDLFRRKMQVHKGYYGRAPSLFALNINREGRDPRTARVYKIEGTFPIRDSISIPVATFEDGQFYTREHRYRCCGIVFHIGAKPKSGHYVSCARIGDKWIYFNDDKTPMVISWDQIQNDDFKNPHDESDRARFKVADERRPTIVIALYQLTNEPASEKNPF